MRSHASGDRIVPTVSKPSCLGDAILLLGMVVMLATFLSLVSFAMIQSEKGKVLARATMMATTLAEEFAASPSDAHEVLEDSEMGLIARRNATREPAGRGLLYRATIAVSDRDTAETVYEIVTARYVRPDETGDQP